MNAEAPTAYEGTSNQSRLHRPDVHDKVVIDSGGQSFRDGGSTYLSDTQTYLASGQCVPQFSPRSFTAAQLVATGNFDGPTYTAHTRIGAYVSDAHTEKLASTGVASFDASVLKALERLPPGVTISFEVKAEYTDKLRRGKSPIFYILAREYSRDKAEFSHTLGVGSAVGVFVSVADSGRDWSIGVYGTIGPISLQESINVTEAFRGILMVETAAIYEIGNESIQVSQEVKPIEVAYDSLFRVLGPMTDYRNFIHPLSRY